jgi:hypothetical protein
MQVRDWYINVLEKRATEGVDDSQVEANKDLKSNQNDQKAELKSLFNSANKEEKADTKLLNRCCPIARKTEGTTTSSTLLKVSMNQAFFDGLRDTGFMKTADPEYLRVAFQGFEDEISKIAGTFSVAPKALSHVEGALAKATRRWDKPFKAHKSWPAQGPSAAIKALTR